MALLNFTDYVSSIVFPIDKSFEGRKIRLPTYAGVVNGEFGRDILHDVRTTLYRVSKNAPGQSHFQVFGGQEDSREIEEMIRKKHAMQEIVRNGIEK